MLNTKKSLALGLLPLLLAGSQIAWADSTETFFGSVDDSAQGGNNPNTARAVFDLNSSGLLTVTLTALSAPAQVPTDVLTGLFFKTAPGTLTNRTVSLAAGSSAIDTGGSTITDISGYWGAASGINAHGDTFAISSTGCVNGLGHANFIGSANQQLQGVGGGTVVGIASGANAGVTGHGPFMDNSVIFTFTTSNFSLSDLGTVIFQYGTSLSEPYGTGTLVSVPEASVGDFLAVDFSVLALFAGFYCVRRKPGSARA